MFISSEGKRQEPGMLKIKPIIIYVLNLLLISASWWCYKFPHGDEYLFLFMIPLLFIIAPFMQTMRQTIVLAVINLAFFVFYNALGALNTIDTVVLMALLGSVAGSSYMAKDLFMTFSEYHKADIQGRQRRYNTVVNELEAMNRRGRKIESELSRITRLYEITKTLAPVLKFDDLLEELFGFLEETFRFRTAHLLVFSGGKFNRGISKSVGSEDYASQSGEVLDYTKLIEAAEKREFKPFFVENTNDGELFDNLGITSDTFMVFPLFVADKLCAIVAIEGASRPSYGRFGILTPQIALEFRKVELYERVQELSIIDGLTEVYLRRYMMTRLEEEVDRAGRLGLTFSLAMIDVDHFKKCNDNYGHLVGDAVLKRIAERLKGAVREVDMIARYGGEEFCVILPDTTKDLASTVSERLRKSIEKEVIKVFDEEIKATVSIGVSTYPKDGKEISALIDKADMALYKAKRNGRNRVCLT